MFNLGNREVEAGAQTINNLPKDTPFLLQGVTVRKVEFQGAKNNGHKLLIYTNPFFNPSSNGNLGKPFFGPDYA